MLDVPDVFFHPFFHLPYLACLATASRHLRPARDAWLAEVAHHVLGYEFGIFLCVEQHVWPWTDDRHVAYQDVPELWQLIDVVVTHELTKTGLSRVVLRGLDKVAVFVHLHAPELVAPEFFAIQAVSALAEEDGAWHGQFDDDGDNDGQPPEDKQQEEAGEADVEQPFAESVGQ